MNLADLKKPFDPTKISWRVGSTTKDKSKGLALAYIDARDVQERLDEVCGAENWQNRFALLGQTTICEIGIRIENEFVWKSDGAGETDVEGEKGSLSSAFKRAAVHWGIGRYLYDVAAPWVELEPAGNSYKIKATEKRKLEAILSGSPGPKSEAPAPSTASGVGNTPASRAAVEWAKKAIFAVQGFRDVKTFDDWHIPNREKIAKIKDYDPELHKSLLEAIDHCLARLNPIAAG